MCVYIYIPKSIAMQGTDSELGMQKRRLYIGLERVDSLVEEFWKMVLCANDSEHLNQVSRENSILSRILDLRKETWCLWVETCGVVEIARSTPLEHAFAIDMLHVQQLVSLYFCSFSLSLFDYNIINYTNHAYCGGQEHKIVKDCLIIIWINN